MFVAALLDLGAADLDFLRRELAKLPVAGYRLRAEKVLRNGIAGTQFHVDLEEAPGAHRHESAPPSKNRSKRTAQVATNRHSGRGTAEHHSRSHADIRRMIEGSALAQGVKARSLEAFRWLAEAEGKVHGRPPEEVTFHEIGAVDSIVDIVGACAALEKLAPDEILCGPLALGGDAEAGAARGGSAGHGYLRSAHGLLPAPAFATLELVRGLPLRACPAAGELTTPTGAALVRAAAKTFGPLPAMRVERIGCGAGSRDDGPLPNLFRVVLGELEGTAGRAASEEWRPDAQFSETDKVLELQANLDDATPEILGYLTERLLALGALEVFLTPVVMKKTRPGTLVTVLAPVEPAGAAEQLTAALFSETPTFGVRGTVKRRAILARESVAVETPWGRVRVKLGRFQGRIVSAHPEYEDCRALAEAKGVPLREVLFAAESAARNLGAIRG
jgi:hypothetical protein